MACRKKCKPCLKNRGFTLNKSNYLFGDEVDHSQFDPNRMPSKM